MKWGVTMETLVKQNQIVKVLRLGPFIVDAKRELNTYYLSKGSYDFLIDLPPLHKMDQMIRLIEENIQVEMLSHIIILNSFFSTVLSLKKMIEHGFHGVVMTNGQLAHEIINSDIKLKIIIIDEQNFLLDNDESLLSFIPMYFLPYPEMFMVYEPTNNILFSHLLMSSYDTKKAALNTTELQKQILLFHKEMMPSSIFISPVIKKLKNIKIQHIFPSYGSVIIFSQVEHILDYLSKMSFHNNYEANLKSGLINENFDYIEVINQLLIKLKNHFSRIEIINTFVGSPFHLDQESLTLKKTTLIDYKLWHSFFDYVYSKKGMTWLTIIEPVMKHLMDTYRLELPAIYRSETLKLRQEAEILEEKKSALESHLKELTLQIENAKDELLRDKLTLLYTQEILIKMMTEHFSHQVASHNLTRGLLLIQLDQLPDINRRFNKEIGDETVRNMAYVIDQVKSDFTLLFKQSGPGIYALIEDQKFENIINEAVKIKNAVSEATSFIEKVSVSIAVVTCKEVDQTMNMDEKLKFLMSTIEKRMAYAKVKGQGLIIDETFELPESLEGSILLVDQDEINRNMLYRIFKRAHYEIVLADSVIEAFQILHKRKIDIVISEINLSKMDGFQLKMRMNESKAFKDIPFIMVSHNKTIDNIKRGNLLAVDLILEKPIVPEELIGHINRMKDRVKK